MLNYLINLNLPIKGSSLALPEKPLISPTMPTASMASHIINEKREEIQYRRHVIDRNITDTMLMAMPQAILKIRYINPWFAWKRPYLDSGQAISGRKNIK